MTDILRAIVDPYEFMLRYYPERLRVGNTEIVNAKWQIRSMRQWGKMISARDDRGASMSGMVAESWPREFGKTTIGHIVLLWAILMGHRRYAVMFRVNQDMASAMVAEYLRKLSNPTDPLVIDAGLEEWASYAQRRKGLSWSTDKIHVNNIYGELACIQPMGAGASPRGLLDNGRRPDLIDLDDIETTETVNSKRLRKKNEAWLDADIKPLGANALILFKQTTISPSSLMSKCQSSPLWHGRSMPALDENGESTWPERYTTKELCAKRDSLPSSVWLSDYQNSIIANEATLFPVDDWKIYEDEEITPPQMIRVVIGVDLAFSAVQTSDHTAISAWGEDRAGDIHHIYTRQGRWATPEEVIEQIENVDKIALSDKIVIEDVSSSKHFISFCRKKIGGKVQPISHMGLDKTARARMVKHYWEMNRVWRHRADNQIVQSLYSFRPDITQQDDDIVDAAVYAILGLRRGGVRVYQ